MKKLLFLLSIFFTTLNINAETFKEGSYIINMGVIPQTYNNGLLPYGMAYDMVINQEVPLYWIIKSGKQLFETDFTYNSTDYKAGSLVLPAIYVTPAVETAIAEWRARGVVIDGPTTSDFDAPVYNYISSFPTAVIDSDNFALTFNLFYRHAAIFDGVPPDNPDGVNDLPTVLAGIPNDYYGEGSPSSITACTDVYALPHADPQDWSDADIATYKAYVDGKAQSFLWQGCHSVGAVESPTYLDMHILTTNGQIAWDKDNDYEFINENSEKNFEHESSAGDEPIMQIASELSDSSDAAQTDGSQKIYIPRPDSAWRSSTTVAVWDPANINLGLNGGNPNKAALVAFGRAYGDPENGILIQQASHTSETGTEAQNVSSGRIYANLLLQSSIAKRPIVSINAPNQLYYPNSYEMSATVARGTAPFDFEWSITCDGNDSVGTFSPATQLDVNESNVTFTPANVTLGNCILRVKVTDDCGRKNFDTKILGITGYHPPLGVYNVTHTGEDFSTAGGKDTLDTAHPVNSLYTQISGKTFDVDIVALGADKETLLHKEGNVMLELIDTRGITDLDPSSCAKASAFSDETSKIALNANGGHFDGNITAHASGISYPNAVQEVGFRVSYFDLPLAGDTDYYVNGIPHSMSKEDLDNQFPTCSTTCTNDPADWSCYKCIATSAIKGGYGKSVCARDNFAIRPSSFKMSLLGTTPFIGGKNYPFTIDAITHTGANDILYTEPSISTATVFVVGSTGFIDSNLSIPVGCDINQSTSLQSWQGGSVKFVQGVGQNLDDSTLSYVYNNVGDVNITAYETSWASIDIDKTPTTANIEMYSDCIKGSGSNTVVNGKIGCNVAGSYLATFIPASFKNTLKIQNHNTDGNFTYVADHENDQTKYGAKMTITHAAVLDDKTTIATNYTAGCYANNITTTLVLDKNISLGWDDTLSRIWLYDKNSSTVLTETTPANYTITRSEASFEKGVTTANMLFDFDRRINTPDNPFNIAYLDFNITNAQDTVNSSVVGSDFNRTAGNSNESNVTFYYGRARASQDFYENIQASTVNTPVIINIYCALGYTQCDTLDIDTVNGQTGESQWWISINHNAASEDGNVTLKIGALIEGTGAPTVAPTNIQVISKGIFPNVTVTANAVSLPMTVPIELVIKSDPTAPPYTNAWLMYNKDTDDILQAPPSPFYKARFIGATGWTGVGKTGHILDINASIKKSRRLNW